MSKMKHISFRMNPSDVKWIQANAKKFNATQGEILSKCIQEVQGAEGKILADKVIQKTTKYAKGGSVANAETDMLTKLGISSVSGLLGYYLSGYIREQMELDKDKGTQILIGLAVGLGTQIIQEVYNGNK